MEDIVYHDNIGQEAGLKRQVTLDGLNACHKLAVGQIMMQEWGPSKTGEDLWSFQSAMHNISKGNASYPPPLAKVNHHIGNGLGCRLQVKGHGRGLGFFGVKGY
jgi:hypothetical protein